MAYGAELPFRQVGFSFERNFNTESWLAFFQANWTYSIHIGIVYLVVVFGVAQFMRNRTALYFTRLESLSNLTSTLMNGYSAYRLWQDYFIYRSLLDSGSTVCHNYSCNSGVHGLTMVVFAFVKVVMLTDTLFLVLQKQTPSFAIVYHHLSILISAWYCGSRPFAYGRYAIMIDCTCHVILYGYLTIKTSRRIRIPRFIHTSMLVLVLVECFLVFIFNFLAYLNLYAGEFAGKKDLVPEIAFVMAGSYFVLFAQTYFFS